MHPVTYSLCIDPLSDAFASISLDGMELNSGPAAFWTSFGASIQDSLPKNRLAPIRSGRDFLTPFRADKKSLQKKSIVLVIDEFSNLDKADPVIQDQFLRTFRQYKQYKKLYAIHSVVACGTFSSLHLSSTSLVHSPFNVASYVQVPYFSQEQTAQLFDEFAKDWRVTIDPSVVRDIWMNSNGCAFNSITIASFLSLFAAIREWWAYAGAQFLRIFHF
jgi:hypothetical protein